MKKFIILLFILIFPTAFYIYLSFGAVRYKRTPFFGPRTVIADTVKSGKTDTAYFTIPVFEAQRIGGGNFNLKTFQGRMYATAFLDPDSATKGWNMGPLLTDYKVNKETYRGISFLFIWPADSGATPPPDFRKEMNIPTDSVVMLTMPRKQFDSLRTATYFIPDPARVKEPFTRKMHDLVLVDDNGHIRGYYNTRYLSKAKEMKEDILHIRIRDAAFETAATTKIDQKKK